MMIEIEFKFSKMHGIGNDFILIDESKETIIPEEKKEYACYILCNRHFGIGADGVLFVTPSKNADIGYRMFNPDGSEAEMCGNGIRCFGKFVYENNIIRKGSMNVETKAGIKTVDVKLDEKNMPTVFKVNMGLSSFDTDKVPMLTDNKEFIDEDFDIDGENFKLTAINVGNPHAVIFVNDTRDVNIKKIGSLIENSEVFPEKINVHIIETISRSEGKMETWERGVGATLACGTGATSCAIVGYKLGLFGDEIHLHLPGGELKFDIYEEDGELGAYMEGAATLIFNGKIKIKV